MEIEEEMVNPSNFIDSSKEKIYEGLRGRMRFRGRVNSGFRGIGNNGFRGRGNSESVNRENGVNTSMFQGNLFSNSIQPMTQASIFSNSIQHMPQASSLFNNVM